MNVLQTFDAHEASQMRKNVCLVPFVFVWKCQIRALEMVMLRLDVPYFSWFEIEKTALIFGNAMFFFKHDRIEWDWDMWKRKNMKYLYYEYFRYLFSVPGLNFASHDSMMVLRLFFTPTSGGKDVQTL